MYTGNTFLAGIKISFADNSKLISIDECKNLSNLFESNLNEISFKYPNLDIKSYATDLLILFGKNQSFKTKLTPGNFLEIKIDEYDKEKYINDKMVHNSFLNFMKWGSDSKLRKIMDELFCGSVEEIYEKLFNKSIRTSDKINIDPEKLKTLGLLFCGSGPEIPIDEYSKYPNDIVLMVLNFYKDFLTTFLGEDFNLLIDPEAKKKFNYYKILKFLKESYIPHKDNKMMEEIFLLLPNGVFYMNMIKSICELGIFQDFENIELSKLMD